MKIYLLRHGETEWNADKRLQGASDIPLNARGIAQASAWRNHFERIRLHGIYSSPLARTMHTAALATGRPACVMPELSERHFGAWQGRRWSELTGEIPDFIERWRDVRASAPDGESLEDVARRVRPKLAEIMRDHDRASEILIVTHGGVGKVIHGVLLDLPLEEMPAVPVLHNGGLTTFLNENSRWKVAGEPS